MAFVAQHPHPHLLTHLIPVLSRNRSPTIILKGENLVCVSCKNSYREAHQRMPCYYFLLQMHIFN